MEPITEARFRKFNTIVELYKSRENTQVVIAQTLGMDVEDVGTVTRMSGCSHTKRMTPDNVNPGQLIPALIKGKDLEFLDKYNF